jgi:excisionase family DNA binding protein
MKSTAKAASTIPRTGTAQRKSGLRSDLAKSDVMKFAEAAQYLRIHRTTLHRLLKAQKIPAFRIGSDWRFNREQIDRWRLAQGQ